MVEQIKNRKNEIVEKILKEPAELLSRDNLNNIKL